MSRFHWFSALATVVLLALSTPCLAYTIFLKDGTQVIAQKKYEIVDGKAILTLTNGTQVSYDPAAIDVEKTESQNLNDYGTAIRIQDGQPTAVQKPTKVKRAPTLSDLIREKRAGIRAQEQSRRDKASEQGIQLTASGAPDLESLEPTPLANLDLVGDLQQYFRSQGIANISILQSVESNRPLIRTETNSEASIFRAVAVAASALLEMEARHGSSLEGLDLLLVAEGNSRAGQFSMTPAMAQELVNRETEISRFYVKYVEF